MEARDDTTAELVSDLRKRICHETARDALIQSVHVICFCQRDNVLSQWRSYGSEGGYSLGFSIEDGSIQGLMPESPSFTALLSKVEYDEAKQLSQCKQILDSVLPVVDSADQSIFRDTKATTTKGLVPTYDFVLNALEEMLLDEILGFKNKAFEEEDEWRLIIRPRIFLLQGRDDHGKTPTKRYFRKSRGLIVPYLRIVPATGKLPIRSIRSGPSLDKVRAEASVRLLMREFGFPEPEFTGSEIPVLM